MIRENGHKYARSAEDTMLAIQEGRLPASWVSFDDMVPMLLELYNRSKERAIALARKLLSGDPQFDAKLLNCFRAEGPVDWPDTARLIALDILDVVSERDRLVLGVSIFLKHPNAKVRSKAALFIARRRPTLTWISDLSGHSDARVRANILEGLYESDEDFIAPLFRKHASDENNRVAGNAMLGLYRLGEADSIPLIDEMAKDERREFRVTSAWVMGQTGDPRFSAILAGQLSDSDPNVRKQALSALGAIKKSLVAVRTRNPLQVAVLNYRVDRESSSLLATVCDASGQAIRAIHPTGFLLKAGGNYVRKYDLSEYSSPVPVHAAFAMCLPDGQAVLGTGFEDAVERCSPLLRRKDELSVLKLTNETDLRETESKIIGATAVSRNAFEDVTFGQLGLHLILVGATPSTQILKRIFELGSAFSPTIHVIAVSPKWRTPEVREQTLSRGGYFSIATSLTVTQACVDIYSSLLHHYRIVWAESEGNLELVAQSGEAAGLANYQPGKELL